MAKGLKIYAFFWYNFQQRQLSQRNFVVGTSVTKAQLDTTSAAVETLEVLKKVDL